MRAFSPPTRFAVVLLIVVSFSFTLLLLFISGGSITEQGFRGSSADENRRYTLSSAPHRKLLLLSDHPSASMGREEPNRMWGDKCSKGDIVINQGPTAPLPSGIPSYTVEIMNACVTGCDISRIHVNCGWFSSARLINPKIFKRLRYNDCLVNDGKPLVNGGTLSFEYANTFLYPLKVSSVVC